ncbi:uncharacterized protein LOC121733183 [Aricia agestis]|uniref:uncharacterized protein LOC121733183 n=1 Tax=Aricia agestis TaxID=91739 RepID=UPI001C2080F7|nr:uncharacterized protein LOC121733183 [Aricia agestis]
MQYEDGTNICWEQRREQRLDIQPTVVDKHVTCDETRTPRVRHTSTTNIVCAPPTVSFVNFEIGKSYTKRLRITNKSPSELRVSVKPPSSNLLQVELCSKLVILSGGDAIVRIHFRPITPLKIEDKVVIRTEGQDLKIPILCYIKHPVLNVIVNDSIARCENNTIYIGATLVSNTLRVPITFHSDSRAKFIIISDKCWSDFTSDDNGLNKAILQAEVSKDKSGNSIASSDCFTISPSCYANGTVPAAVVCCPFTVGFHTTLFRIVSSTAIVRSLRFFADAVVYEPHHIRLKADERDYDILTGVEDPACQYYVHIGRTAPRGELIKTITLENASPVPYKYYWRARPWSNCGCPFDGSSDNDTSCCCEKPDVTSSPPAQSVYPKPSRGVLPPGSSISVEIRLYCAGQTLGVQRSVLMLILTEVPVESVSSDVDVLKKDYIDEETVPSLAKKRTRVLCDILSAQLEVWWEVAPVTVALHPPALDIHYSRRVQSIPLTLNVTELHGVCGAQGTWESPVPMSPIRLVPNGTTTVTVVVPLQDNDDVDIRLLVDGSCASTHIQSRPEPQFPSLSPPYTWAGTVAPGAVVTAKLVLRNDTSRMLHWWTVIDTKDTTRAKPCVCGDQCPDCLVNPYLGTLDVDEEVVLKYKTQAMKVEGWQATLVQVCTDGDDGDFTKGCAAVVAYRVLEPRLVLRVLSDGGTRHNGSAVLRPPVLSTGHSTQYRLSITNTTPVSTLLRWETTEDNVLRVAFSPNVTEVGGYETVDVTVTLLPCSVCRQRVFVCKAAVQHSSQPLCLPIVAAIAGIEVRIEIPLSDGASRIVILTEPPAEESSGGTHEDMLEEFHRTGTVSVYNSGDRCAGIRKLGEDISYSMEFIGAPVNTVSSKSLVVRNVSLVDAAVVLAVRRWPRQRKTQKYPNEDQWLLHDSGIAVECTPWSMVVRAGGRGEVVVTVHGDTWGVYRERLLVMVEKLEPLVIDLWIEVFGAPLQFAISDNTTLPVVWLASTDPKRILQATNHTRADIHVYSFVVKDLAPSERKLPFRLYFRLYEVSSKCLCAKNGSDTIDTTTPNNCLHPDMGIELFLDDDYGRQDSICYRVEPEYVLVGKHQKVHWSVSLTDDKSSAPSALVVRSTPVQSQGEDWFRPSPPAQLVKLRTSARTPHLEVSQTEVTVEICALDLSPDDVIRKRRRLEIRNTGNGFLTLSIKTKEPWRVKEDKCDQNSARNNEEKQDLQKETTELVMLPNSSKEVSVKLELEAKHVVPEPGDQYPSDILNTTPLYFYDEEGREMLNIPLTLHVDRPVLAAEPALIDFGLVSDGHAKKSYFTLTHTSRTRTVEVAVYISGDENFKIHPEKLTLAPGERQNVYLQYTCRWTDSHTALALIRVRGGADWCAVSVQARAHPTRYVARSAVTDHADFTVDDMLLPPML